MNKLQVAQLLTIASGLDTRITLDDLVVEAWMEALGTINFEDARAAIITWYQTQDKKIMVANVRGIIRDRAALRRNPSQIAEDVREAKELGVVPDDWDERQPLGNRALDLRRARQEQRWRSDALAPKPDNFDPMSAAHSNPVQFAREVATYDQQLAAGGFRPVHETYGSPVT
jgi:hypothetical protein